MITFISEKHGSSYTLWRECVLLQHPLYSDGTVETNEDAYCEVEWEYLEDDEITECERVLGILKAQFKATVHPTYTDTPMAEEYYGG